ncbi:unnamed protein product [Phaeothamnion confervicola]
MNITRSLAALALSLAALTGAAPAHAEPSELRTVDGVDYPVCSQEDCSDQPGQIGVWFNREGAAWLSLGERSIPVTA